MKKEYELPKFEIVNFKDQIKMLDSSIVIEYPWGSDYDVFFEE